MLTTLPFSKPGRGSPVSKLLPVTREAKATSSLLSNFKVELAAGGNEGRKSSIIVASDMQ
jgi:hypothetical protein